MKGQTKLVTPVYTKPIPNKEFLALQVLAFRDFTVTAVEKYINPYDCNKEEVYTFGKTPAGWLVLSHDNVVYFEEEACPTCLCAISEEPHFELPCCGNKLHADCFIQQMKSFTGGFWSESHITCPLCRENYFGEGRTSRYFWVDYHSLNDVLYQIPGFNWDDFENLIYRTHRTVQMIKELVEEKEKDLPKEEHGGWAIQICEVCRGPGIRGKLSCAEEMNIDLSAKYVCDTCEWGQKNAKDHRCFVHGKKYAMFKCDSCCAVATWDCFSNHYCERCHNMACETKHFPCPGPDKCPLGIAHPQNSHGRHGESNLGFVIGCFKCFDPTYEVNSSYNERAPDPFRADDIANENNLGMFQYSAPPPPQPEKPIAEFVSPEQDEIYDEFIRQFQDSEVETDSSDSEMEESSESDEILYQGFIAQFNASDEEICSDYEEEILYQGFIAQFNDASDEESCSDYEEEMLYKEFITQFEVSDEEICSDSEIEKFEENIENYRNFISQFEVSDDESSSCYSPEYESDSSEISIEEETLAFSDNEEGAQLLPILAPRPMTSCDSISSVFSEDTVNLLNFNLGFMEDGESDIVSSPPPAMVQICSHEVTVV